MTVVPGTLVGKNPFCSGLRNYLSVPMPLQQTWNCISICCIYLFVLLLKYAFPFAKQLFWYLGLQICLPSACDSVRASGQMEVAPCQATASTPLADQAQHCVGLKLPDDISTPTQGSCCPCGCRVHLSTVSLAQVGSLTLQQSLGAASSLRGSSQGELC